MPELVFPLDSSKKFTDQRFTTVYLPAAIFDIDLTPSVGGPARIDPGAGVPRSGFGA